jgi:hypothetical protein
MNQQTINNNPIYDDPFLSDCVTGKTIIPRQESNFSTEETLRLNTLKHQITSTTENFLTDIGAYFKEVQDILASHDKTKGKFIKFIEECGYKWDTVDRMVKRYNYLSANGGNIDYLETLPTRVLAAAGSKNATPQLSQAVINGDIKTIKELDEWKRKYQEQTLRVMELNNAITEKEDEIQSLAMKQIPDVRTIEIQAPINDDVVEKAVDEATKEYQAEIDRQIQTIRQSELLMEDKESVITNLHNKMKRNEKLVSDLTIELERLRPLKEKAEEIEKLKKELDKRKDDLRIINLDMDIYKALREAKEVLHQKVLNVATITRVPEKVSSNMKEEIKQIHEIMNNFIFATTEKFQLNK